MEQAARLFDKASYNGVNMDDIAATAGIAKPTLYHYFGSKDEILYGIYDALLDELLGRMEARVEAKLDSRQLLLEIMSDVLEMMDSHRGHIRALYEHHRELPAERWNVIREKRDHYEAGVRRIVTDGIEQGEFREVDPVLTTHAVLGMCNWAYQWYRRGDDNRRPREIAHHFWNLVIQGLAQPSPPADGRLSSRTG